MPNKLRKLTRVHHRAFILDHPELLEIVEEERLMLLII
jgi:hypothetical protein